MLRLPKPQLETALYNLSRATLTAPRNAALSVSDEAWVVHEAGQHARTTSQTDAHTRAARTGGVALPASDLVQMGNV